MLWIEYRQNEAIPMKLYYNHCNADKDNYDNTPFMLWSKYRPNEPFITGIMCSVY